MKKYTHAWLAFMAIKRLEDVGLSAKLPSDDCSFTNNLIEFFKSHRDDVIQGAWYPDSLIKDNSNSHVLKFDPCDEVVQELKQLPTTYLICKYGGSSPVKDKGFKMADPKDNLPDRCESIAESVVDHLKVQHSVNRGSPVSPTDNQVALWLFMLSHYVADAHVPFHCDYRKFSEGENIHGKMEGEWEKEIEHYYEIDKDNERFLYNKHYYPLMYSDKDQEYESSYLKRVENELCIRDFNESFGTGNNNVRGFIKAVCQHSYLLSFCFLPPECSPENVTLSNWKTMGSIDFEDLSAAVLTDTIDSISRILFRVWRRCDRWKKE